MEWITLILSCTGLNNTNSYLFMCVSTLAICSGGSRFWGGGGARMVGVAGVGAGGGYPSRPS